MSASTLVGRRGPAGIEGWRAGPEMPAPRFHHASVAAGGFVYVTGGIERDRSTASVFRARVGADGAPGEWVPLENLPRPRSHHASFIHGGALYVVAGLDGDPAGENEPLRDVMRAPLRADGSIGEWTAVSTLPASYATHSAFVADCAIYVLGGVEDNARFVDVILRAPLDRRGIGDWERLPPGLPAARGHVHQTPVEAGRVYSVGGSHSRRVSGETYIGRLP